jgi:hypothetical protein
MTSSNPVRFDGETYVPGRDKERLSGQLDKVRTFMLDGRWRTLEEIANAVKAPQASVSSRLRDLRKDRFGGFIINRRYVEKGLFQYQLQISVFKPQKLFPVEEEHGLA